MYIKRLSIQNIRCFEELEISFDKPGSSVLILGDNGDGKSTVLRSLAMGLCDESSAAALFRELPGEFVRRPADKAHVPEGDHGTICVDLEHEDDNGEIQYYRIKTKVSSGKIFERVSQHGDSDKAGLYQLIKNGPNFKEAAILETAFPWDEFFVSGYGAGSRSQGTADYRYYLPVDAVYPIFNYTMSLQNPELAIRRLIDAAHKAATNEKEREEQEQEILVKVKKLLTPILGLNDEDSIELTSNAILVKGPWGKSELGELGDGYRATVTWILDLLSWWFLYFFAPETADQTFDEMVRKKWSEFLLCEPTGIVIIDEIDQHLHPRWQHSILESLIKAFPKIQFIATTHSPLVASGSDDVFVLQLEDGGVKELNTYGWLAEDVYRIMGLESSRAPSIEEKLIRFSQLDAKQRSSTLAANEEEELVALKDTLRGLPRGDPAILLRELSNMARTLDLGNDQ